jgi:hypothetical protein
VNKGGQEQAEALQIMPPSPPLQVSQHWLVELCA